MVKDSVKEVIYFLEDCLKQKGLNVENVILFGSHMRGDTTGESDVDIAIVSRDFEGKDIFERARLTQEAEILTIKKFLIPLDIVTLTPGELGNRDSMISEYVRKGISANAI